MTIWSFWIFYENFPLFFITANDVKKEFLSSFIEGEEDLRNVQLIFHLLTEISSLFNWQKQNKYLCLTNI